MTATTDRATEGEVELSLKGKLDTFKGKLDSLFNPALHPRGYHGRFAYTGAHDLKKAEASERKAARHEQALARKGARRGGGRRSGRGRSRLMRNHNWPNGVPNLGGLGGKGLKGKPPPKGPKPAKPKQPPKGRKPAQQSQRKGSGSSARQGSSSSSSKKKSSTAAAAVKAAKAAVAKATTIAKAPPTTTHTQALLALLRQAEAELQAVRSGATGASPAQKTAMAALVAQLRGMWRDAVRAANPQPKPSVNKLSTPALVRALELAAGSMAKASSPEPVGTNDLWWKPGFQLPDYIEHIANDLIGKRGKDEQTAVAMAVGIVKRWAAGSPSGGMSKIKPSTVAAAQKALAEWEALKARAKSVKSTRHFTAGGNPPILDLARRARRRGPPAEAAMPAITGRRYRRYRQQGYTAVSALARVAREAQARAEQETELARQDGAVPVSSTNDGPRVTGNALGKGGRRVASKSKSKRSWDTASNRKSWAQQGIALPDGSFPIPSAAFVHKAAKALGRAPASKRARVRAHIRKRAKALGVTPPALGN
jgi:hypothetical protein